MKPITRREALFSRLAGEAAQTGKPVTREERMLAGLADGNEELPVPVTRRERFLAGFAGGKGRIDPVTRRERFWAAAAGYGSAPTPVTREERLLAALTRTRKTTEPAPLTVLTDAAGGTAKAVVTIEPRMEDGAAVSCETLRLTRAGRNLMDPAAMRFALGEPVTQNGVTVTMLPDGRFALEGEASQRTDIALYPAGGLLRLPEGKYTFSLSGNEDVSAAVHLCASGWGTTANGAGYMDIPRSAMVSVLRGHLPWAYMYLRIYPGTALSLTLCIQAEAGEQATGWTPYTGESRDIALPEGFTGGTVTLEADGAVRIVSGYGVDGEPLDAPQETRMTIPPLTLASGENTVYASAGTLAVTYSARS